MDTTQRNENEEITIDLGRIFKELWKRVWIIILAAAVAGAVGFVYSSFFITPLYSSSILLYVNNRADSTDSSSSISSADISASQSLVNTYTELLKNRTTLEKVVDLSKVDYDYEDLYDMIEAGSASNNVQVMQVTVTADDANDAAAIANAIAAVLPGRIEEIIEGASMKIVDSAIPNEDKVSPSVTKYTAIGLMLGVFVAVAVIALIAILDDTVHDEQFIIEKYGYPILAKIPDLTITQSGGYYKQSSRSTSAKNIR